MDIERSGGEAETGLSRDYVATPEIGALAAAAQAGRMAGAQRVSALAGPVVLPAGVDLDDIKVSGRDLVVQLPDGTQLIIVDGAIYVPQIVIAGIEIPSANIAALLIGDEPQPAAGPAQSSGGNFAAAEGDIGDPFDLGDLLPPTELAFTLPEQQEIFPVPPEEDEEPGVVIVTDDVPAGATDVTDSVNEAGLPARGDEPAGSNAAANSETTTGTIVFEAGDAPAVIAINDVAVTAVGQTFATAQGVLTITSIDDGEIGYSYTLADNVVGAGQPDVFTVTVTDSNGDVATATLTITVVDDAPVARADTDLVAAGTYGPESGNVITGEATASGSTGADTRGADDAQVAGVAAGATAGGLDDAATLGVPIAGQYGVLTLSADGDYSYIRNAGTPGGVSDVFTYTLKDGDGDLSSATLTIAIGNSPVMIVTIPEVGEPGTVVDESGLAERPEETPGSNEPANIETTSGTITYTAPDGPVTVGISSVTINGQPITQVGQTIATDLGVLTITGLSEGVIEYSYQSTDNGSGDDVVDEFTIVVTDVDGDSATGTLTITIVDDVPTAVSDFDSVTEDGPLIADGNVLSGSGGSDGNATDGAADTQGADGATVTAVSFGEATGTVGQGLAGLYGVLTLGADGGYSYALDNGNGVVQGLDSSESLTEVFSYTITDGDGDTSSATLTIRINGSDDGVTITGLDGEGAEETLFENDLADGSSPDAAGLTQAGDFTLSALDGVSTITVGGQAVFTGGAFVPGVTISNSFGTLTITDFDPVFGADGDVIGGTVSYSYELTDNTLLHIGGSGSSLTQSFEVVVTDSDGSNDSADLDITVTDDAPSANDDAAGLSEGGPSFVTFDVDSNDTPGADGTASRVFASLTGTYGDLTLNGDGTQTYTLNGAGQAALDALPPGETLTDIFTYVLTDGDGDSDPATVTVTLTGTDDPVIITDLTPKAEGGDAIVDEDDLATGSDGEKEPLTQAGDFTISAPDGVASLSVGGQQVIANGLFTAVSFTTALGNTLSIESYDPDTGVITYSYALTAAETHENGDGQNSLFEDFTVSLTDADGDNMTATLSVNIVDDVPAAANDSANVAEDMAVVIDVLANDVKGADGVSLTSGVALATGPAKGTAVYNGDGTFTYSPAPGEEGADSFTYTITDADGDSSTATVNLMLTGDSEPLVKSTVSLTVDEDGFAAANVDEAPPAANETDSTESLSASGTAIVNFGADVPVDLGGSIALLDTGALDGQLATLSGTAVTFVLSGGVLIGSAGGTEVIRITITGAAAGPAAGDVTYSYSTLLSQPVRHVTDGTENSVTLNGVSFEVTDSDGDKTTGTFNVTVVDDAPSAVNDGAGQTTENQSFTIDALANDAFGADGVNVSDGTKVFVSTQASQGVVTYSTVTHLFTYTPNAGAGSSSTADSFQYTIVDADGDTSVATVTLTLQPDSVPQVVNVVAAVDDDGLTGGNAASMTGDIDANAGEPGATASEAVYTGQLTVNFGGDTGTVSFANLDGASGTVGTETVTYTWSGTLLTATVNAGARTGTALFTVSLSPSGAYTVTLLDNVLHAAGGNETSAPVVDLFYRATDSDGDVNATGKLSITFNDDAPSAVNDGAGQTTENQSFTIDALANDAFGADGVNISDGTKVFVSTQASQGVVSYSTTTHLFTYTPNAGAGSSSTSDSFQYTIVDADGDTSVATVTLTLQPDSVPVAVDISAKLDDDGLAVRTETSATDDNANAGESGSGTSSEAVWTGTLGVSAGSADAPLSFSLASAVGSGPVGTETVSYSYDAGSHTLTATTTSGSRIGTVLFTVQITDTASGAYTVALLNPIMHATQDGTADDNTENNAQVSLTYTVSDSDISADSDTGTISIDFDDDVPTAEAFSASQATENQAFTISIAGHYVAGADGVSLSSGVSFIQPSQGVVTYDNSGTFTYTPASGAGSSSTSDSFTYTVTDADGDSVTRTISVTLQPDSVPQVVDVVAAVDDDGLTGGNAASMTGDIDANAGEPGATSSEAVYTGQLTVNFGGDTGTVSFANLDGTSGTVGTETVDYAWNGATNTLTATGPRGALFTVSLSPSGAYTVTLLDNVLHGSGGNETSAPVVDLFYRATDSDSDVNDTGKLSITFNDDAPSAVAPVAIAVANAASSPVSQSLDSDNDVANNLGADGGTVRFPSSLDGANSGLTAGFVPIIYDIVDDHTLVGKAGGATIFTITLDPATSQYTVDMDAKIDSKVTIDFNAGGYNFVGGNSSWAGFIPIAESVGSPIDNNSQDLLLTPKIGNANDSTINSTANTGGVGSGASVGSTETFRVDFVTDLRGDPHDGAGDYDTAANRDHVFDGHYTVNGASALFKSSNGSTVKITAFDDADGNVIVGDGVKDTINALTISYFGVTSALITPTTTPTAYTVNGHSFTVTLNADGSANVAGVAGSSGSSLQGTVIAVFTETGYNSVEYSWQAGDTFQIGDFGATTLTNQPVTFTVPVEVVDGDGDISASSTLSITANPAIPPVALDLDGDGVEYLTLAAGVTHDYGSGLVNTAWVAPDDGFLAHQTAEGLDIVFTDDAEGAKTDLEGVRLAYDGNKDGVLDAQDAAYASFGVWQDANSNGVVDAGEFKSLADMGIASIDLASDGQGYVSQDGDILVSGQTTYTTQDGKTGIAADVTFGTASVTGSTAESEKQAASSTLVQAITVASMIALVDQTAADEDGMASNDSAASDDVAGTAEVPYTAPLAAGEQTEPSTDASLLPDDQPSEPDMPRSAYQGDGTDDTHDAGLSLDMQDSQDSSGMPAYGDTEVSSGDAGEGPIVVDPMPVFAVQIAEVAEQAEPQPNAGELPAILADALAGGDGPGIDSLLASLPQTASVEGEAIAAPILDVTQDHALVLQSAFHFDLAMMSHDAVAATTHA